VIVFTRIPRGQQHSCLDHVFFKSNDFDICNETNEGVLLTDITDHCLTIISIPILDKVKIIEKKLTLSTMIY